MKKPRSQQLMDPQKVRTFGTVFFACWLLGGVCLGIGTHTFGAAVDGIGYGIVEPVTWVTGLFFAILGGVVAALTYAEFRWFVGCSVSFFLGIVAMFSTFILAFALLPLHFCRVCDTMDAMRACDAATFRERDTCKPGLPCFPRLEKACRLGSETSCSALIKSGQASREAVCRNLRERCFKYNACMNFPSKNEPECFSAELPGIEKQDTSCSAYEQICDEKARD